jgi:exonuclease SbcC
VAASKSTILEAITFALYGESSDTEQEIRQKLQHVNLKSNELFIEFIFKAGPHDNTYMATVKGRRTASEFSDVSLP